MIKFSDFFNQTKRIYYKNVFGKTRMLKVNKKVKFIFSRLSSSSNECYVTLDNKNKIVSISFKVNSTGTYYVSFHSAKYIWAEVHDVMDKVEYRALYYNLLDYAKNVKGD